MDRPYDREQDPDEFDGYVVDWNDSPRTPSPFEEWLEEQRSERWEAWLATLTEAEVSAIAATERQRNEAHQDVTRKEFYGIVKRDYDWFEKWSAQIDSLKQLD